MPKYLVKLEVPSTTFIELEVEADNEAQARARGLDHLGEGSSFITNYAESSESSDQEFGERRVSSVVELGENGLPKD